jgi:hypothetical protein
MIDYQDVLDSIVRDPRYQRNLEWGAVRPGHPEGTVRAHQRALTQSLDVLRPKLSETEYWRLKVLVHTHDLFKGDAERGVPIASPRSHASLARSFLAEFCDDLDLQAMVQYHDEPFALWRPCQSRGLVDQDRLASLLNRISDWNVFLAFQILDGCTEGKDRGCIHWFFQQIAGRVESRFSETDIPG